MDIKKELLKEHSKKQMLKVVSYIGNNPARFKQLIDIFLAGPYRVTQRAAWPLSYCVENNPKLILPHLKVIVGILKKENIHDAVKRNVVRLLQFIDIPKQHHGAVAERCFEFMNSTQPIAVKVFSMTVLYNLSKQLPDLKTELKLVIEEQLPYASAGFLARARKVLKELKK